MSSLVAVKNLTLKTQDGRVLFQDLSFSLEPHQCWLISGSNGSGKTTLARILSGVSTRYEGTVSFNVRLHEIFYLPQMMSLESHLPVHLQDAMEVLSSFQWSPSSKYNLLNPFQFKLFWNKASGGEKKRALLTAAMCKSTQLLILDEPLNHLDQESQQKAVRLLKDQVIKEGKTVVFISHQAENSEFMSQWEACRRLSLG